MKENNHFSEKKGAIKEAISEYEYYKKINDPSYKSQKLSKFVIKQSGSRFRAIMRYAAIIMIPLILTLSALTIFYKDSLTIFKQQEISPGREIAVLELPNGSQIKIENKREQIKEDTINVSANSKLSEVSTFSQAIDLIGSINDFCTDQYIDIIVPFGGVFHLTLDDSTQVWLNSKTRMRFPLKFSSKERKVLVDGEAFFKVAKKNIPFIVSTDKADITVLGTSFNVNCYKEEKNITTALLTGRIKISNNTSNESIYMEPGDCSIFDRKTGEIKKYKDETEFYALWHLGVFKFREQKLEDIITILKRWYEFDVQYDSDEIKDLRFSTIAQKNNPLDEVLLLLQRTNSLKYKRSGRVVKFYQN